MLLSNIELYIITVFTVILFAEFWNVPARIKRILGKSAIKEFKPVDCLPCFSFWISLFTLSPFVIMGTFITFYLINKIIYER